MQTVSETEKADNILQEMLDHWVAQPRRDRAAQLLLVLHELSQEEQREGGHGVTNVELYARLAKRWPGQWTASEPDTIRSTIAGNWKKACDRWNARITGLEERLEEAGLSIRPEIGKDEGGGRANPTRYWLRWRTLPPPDGEEPRPAAVPEGGLRYYTDELREAKWRQRLVDGILLSGMTGRLLVFSILVVVLGTLALIMLMILGVTLQPGNPAIWWTLVLMVGLAWWAGRPLKRLAEDRMIQAPWWLQPFRGPDDRLLELRAKATDRAPHLRLTRYNGTCPRCGAAVEIGQGRGDLRGRMVGRCRQVPTEHVYSFDPVLRVGRPLR